MTIKTSFSVSQFYLSLAFLLLLVWTENCQAQRFKGGLVGGFNFSQIDGDDMVGYHRFGLNGGGYVSAILSERWQLSTELLFSQRGSRLSATEPINGRYDRIKLDLLEVPVLLNFVEWKFHVQAGVSYGRVFNAQIVELSGLDVTDEIELNENVFSLVLGATFFFTEKWGANFQWSRAFSDLQADEGNQDWYSKGISIRALYLLN